MNPMFYFFLALTAVLAATTNAAPVLDTDGDIIFGGSYYVLPAIRGRGGGLSLSGRGDKPCPFDIVQESSEVDEGLPVKFSNWMAKVAFVPESMNLNIETVVTATICMQGTYWRIDDKDQETKRRFVTTGPKPEVSGEYKWRSFFQIAKVENLDAYNILYCPKKCIDVGIFTDENGVRRLALSSKPFLVKFKKADVTEL